MNSALPPAILKAFPNTRYFPEWRLVTWHPTGDLNDELADRFLEFMETEERTENGTFHRFTDFNGLSDIRLKVGHVFELVERRRSGYQGEPVKSALFSDWMVGFGIAKMYETLMAGAAIEVRAFREREAVAEWLGVPVEILLPSETTPGIDH
jgi:hypothetical protein